MYTFQADSYCDSCGQAIRAELIEAERRDPNMEGSVPRDPDDERSYDSDDFPKYGNEDATDYPDHCASRAECLEPIDLGAYGLKPSDELKGAETTLIGALLNRGLTDEGVSYLREMLNDDQNLTPYQTALHAFWRETFSDELASTEPDDEDKPHKGHYSRLGGLWFCDTCNSPYCDLA